MNTTLIENVVHDFNLWKTHQQKIASLRQRIENGVALSNKYYKSLAYTSPINPLDLLDSIGNLLERRLDPSNEVLVEIKSFQSAFADALLQEPTQRCWPESSLFNEEKLYHLLDKGMLELKEASLLNLEYTNSSPTP